MIKTRLAPFTVVGVIVAGAIACSAPQPHSSNGEPPIAVLAEPFREAAIGDTLTFDATDSYDPDNAAPAFPHGVSSFEWTLSRPGGSSASLYYHADGTATLTVDTSGEFAGELVVIDMDGLRSDPASFGVAVEPAPPVDPEADGLFVAMTWTTGSDMDIHLVQEGGEFFISPLDCHYANLNPDWGAPGDLNDPLLEDDSTSGPGPETIRVRDPQTISYDVFAHHYEGLGDSPVSVSIAHDGALVATVDEPSLANDFVWHVGTIAYADSNAAPSFSLIDSVFQNP